MKTVLIGGKEFELCKNTCNVTYKSALKGCPTRSIYNCYGRPSATKTDIWESWCKWFDKHGFYNYGVLSYNCNFFSIRGIAEVDGQAYALTITARHWRATPLIMDQVIRASVFKGANPLTPTR